MGGPDRVKRAPHHFVGDAMSTDVGMHHHPPNVGHAIRTGGNDAAAGYDAAIMVGRQQVQAFGIPAVQFGVGALLFHHERIHAQPEKIMYLRW
jgi:hypothetical protein